MSTGSLIDVHRSTDAPAAPADVRLVEVALATLAQEERPGALSLCLVDSATIRDMNARYRGKDAPTNVLSFPQDVADEQGRALHGDVLLCPEVIEREAKEQVKPAENHYLHLVVHGVLHLLGYDHIEPADADAMESLERAVLATFDIPDPYRAHDPAMTSEYRTA